MGPFQNVINTAWSMSLTVIIGPDIQPLPDQGVYPTFWCLLHSISTAKLIAKLKYKGVNPEGTIRGTGPSTYLVGGYKNIIVPPHFLFHIVFLPHSLSPISAH